MGNLECKFLFVVLDKILSFILSKHLSKNYFLGFKVDEDFPCKRQYPEMIRDARWYIFKPKIRIWVNSEWSCNAMCWYILLPFGLCMLLPFDIFHCHSVHFVVIWYISPLLVCRPKENLAILEMTSPDGQELLSDFLQLFRRRRVRLDQLQQDAHDVHADEGEELLLVDALTGADLDALVTGPGTDVIDF
jgi:hypothetical protein